MWKQEMNRFQMRAGHGKNMCRALDQCCGERLAAQMADIDSFSSADLDCVETGRLPAHCMNAGRGDLDIVPVAHKMMKEAFGDWAAANISRTDEKDAFHDEMPEQPGRQEPRIEDRQVNWTLAAVLSQCEWRGCDHVINIGACIPRGSDSDIGSNGSGCALLRRWSPRCRILFGWDLLAFSVQRRLPLIGGRAVSPFAISKLPLERNSLKPSVAR